MAEDITSRSCGKPLLFPAEFLEGYDVGADKGFLVRKNDDDNGNLHGLLGQSKPMPRPETGSYIALLSRESVE